MIQELIEVGVIIDAALERGVEPSQEVKDWCIGITETQIDMSKKNNLAGLDTESRETFAHAVTGATAPLRAGCEVGPEDITVNDLKMMAIAGGIVGVTVYRELIAAKEV